MRRWLSKLISVSFTLLEQARPANLPTCQDQPTNACKLTLPTPAMVALRRCPLRRPHGIASTTVDVSADAKGSDPDQTTRRGVSDFSTKAMKFLCLIPTWVENPKSPDVAVMLMVALLRKATSPQCRRVGACDQGARPSARPGVANTGRLLGLTARRESAIRQRPHGKLPRK